MAQPDTGMNAYQLLEEAWYDLRADSSSDYAARYGMMLIQRALKFVCQELVQRDSNLIAKEVTSGSADWSYILASGKIQLPDDYLAVYDWHVRGRESYGPLQLMPASSRKETITNVTPGYYYSDQTHLYILRAPDDGTEIDGRYAAYPSLAILALPATDDDCITALQGQAMPLRGLFDQAVRQFVAFSFANSNEYDTNVEQGLYQMLRSAAHAVAAKDDLIQQDKVLDHPSDGYDWTGR